MYKQTIISILLILCALGVRAEDSIKVSATDLKALMQRVERLEQAQANPNKLGYVDGVTGATQRVQNTDRFDDYYDQSGHAQSRPCNRFYRHLYWVSMCP